MEIKIKSWKCKRFFKTTAVATFDIEVFPHLLTSSI